MSDSIADKVINQINREKVKEDNPQYPDQWGIDDTGFPWPNPVNAQAVAIRVFSKWGKVDGVDNIFKIEQDIFINGRRISQNRSTLLSLYDKPKIVLWANSDPELRDEYKVWAQIKKVIGSEWPIVWAIIRDVAPEYNRDYIRVTDRTIWGKNEADIIIK